MFTLRRPLGITQYVPFLLTLALSSAGCESQVSGDRDGGGGGSASASASASSSSGGKWTKCSSPEGFRLCGGPNHCSCNFCYVPYKEVGVCNNSALSADSHWLPNVVSPDGGVYIDGYGDGIFESAPFDLGVLMAKAGGANRVRYADLGLWTGAELPSPASCPSIPNIQICGGNCGGCAVGAICTGRSPLHPYGLCVDMAPGKCAGDFRWFTFTVEPSAQANANKYSLCIPTQVCEAAAAHLPGGGTCSTTLP
jgi:hypothetical protein